MLFWLDFEIELVDFRKIQTNGFVPGACRSYVCSIWGQLGERFGDFGDFGDMGARAHKK